MGLSSQIKGSRQATRRMNKFDSGDMAFVIGLESMADASAFARATDKDTLKAFNSAIEKWTNETSTMLKASIKSMVRTDSSLSNSLKPRLYSSKYGEYNRIGFSFNRQGIYSHFGAGKGQGGSRGSKWESKGIVKTTNPESLGKMGMGNRQANPWFDVVIEKRLPILADVVASYFSDVVLDISKIYLNK